MQEPIEDFLTDVKLSKKDSTHEVRKYDLQEFNRYLEENELDVLEVETKHLHKWLREQASVYAPNTTRGRYASLTTLYGFLAGIQNQVDDDPTEGLKDPSDYAKNTSKRHSTDEIVRVNPEEVAALVEHVPKPKIRNELLIRSIFQTSVRASTASLIEVDNTDRDNRSIRVYAPKTDDTRTVFYQESLDLLLDQWLNTYREGYGTAADSPYLFLSVRSEKMKAQRINRVVREAAENAGIQDVLYEDAQGVPRYRVTAHTLRHGHAVHALKSGVDIRSVQKQMGHSNIESTLQYLQYVNKDVEEAYENWNDPDRDNGGYQ
jgi:integrase/recombinase XerD